MSLLTLLSWHSWRCFFTFTTFQAVWSMFCSVQGYVDSVTVLTLLSVLCCQLSFFLSLLICEMFICWNSVTSCYSSVLSQTRVLSILLSLNESVHKSSLILPCDSITDIIYVAIFTGCMMHVWLLQVFFFLFVSDLFLFCKNAHLSLHISKFDVEISFVQFEQFLWKFSWIFIFSP